jgi:4a-hydroxytetrahydrobiopterin dehydratase
MKLTDGEISQNLQNTPNWNLEQGRLTRVFAFQSYGAGVAFAMQVAMLSEKLDHHPDSLEIGWGKVRIAYVTHDVGGLTKLDFETAQRVDKLRG